MKYDLHMSTEGIKNYQCGILKENEQNEISVYYMLNNAMSIFANSIKKRGVK